MFSLARYAKILFSLHDSQGETAVYRSLILFATAVACAGLLPAQNMMITENKQAYETIKNNILRAAEKMPDSAYSFQATKEERTWAELMGHIADAQGFICSSAG